MPDDPRKKKKIYNENLVAKSLGIDPN